MQKVGFFNSAFRLCLMCWNIHGTDVSEGQSDTAARCNASSHFKQGIYTSVTEKREKTPACNIQSFSKLVDMR